VVNVCCLRVEQTSKTYLMSAKAGPDFASPFQVHTILLGSYPSVSLS
jgi:hypothetical protein